MPLASVVARSSGLRVSTAGSVVSVSEMAAEQLGLAGQPGLGFGGGLGVGTEVEMLGDAVLEFVGIAGEVDVVEAEDAEEVVDAVDVAVGDSGSMVWRTSSPKRCCQRAGDGEGALDGGRADVDVEVEVGAVDAAW